MGDITPNSIIQIDLPRGGRLGIWVKYHSCDPKFFLTSQGLRCLIHMKSITKYCISIGEKTYQKFLFPSALPSANGHFQVLCTWPTHC